MALSEIEQRLADRFREWTLDLFEGDPRFVRIVDVTTERRKEAEFVVRFEVGRESCYEVAFCPQNHVIQMGFLTQDRSLNDAIEHGGLESGETLTEMLQVELDDMGETGRYEVDHFFERPWFCFYTTLPFETITALERDELRLKVQHLLDALHLVFQDYVDREK